MNQKGKKVKLVQGGTNPLGNQASAKSTIVPFMKTHIKNPYGQDKDPLRTRTYQHPNKRKQNTGGWDRV